MLRPPPLAAPLQAVSVLFNEPKLLKSSVRIGVGDAGLEGFSALQRAEIAEITTSACARSAARFSFSALQRAEIAEMNPRTPRFSITQKFQCSSTSRNC